MSEILRHLKHLLFNDAMITHKAGMNHNAMDRSCVYDVFLDHIQSSEFDMIYDGVVRHYYNLREEFRAEPTYTELVPCENGIPLPEEAIQMGIDYELMEVLRSGGYWKSLEDIDEYVADYATDDTVSFLLKKIYEDQNSHK